MMILCLEIQNQDYGRREASQKTQTDDLLLAHCTSKAIKPV